MDRALYSGSSLLPASPSAIGTVSSITAREARGGAERARAGAALISQQVGLKLTGVQHVPDDDAAHHDLAQLVARRRGAFLALLQQLDDGRVTEGRGQPAA